MRMNYKLPADVLDVEALKLVFHYKTFLEDKYSGLVLGEPDCVAEVMSNHIAFKLDEFAKLCTANHINFRTDRVHVDASKGVPETEFVNKDLARDDANRYKNLIHQVIDSEVEWNDLAKLKTFFDGDKMSLIKLIEILFNRVNYLREMNNALIDFIGLPVNTSLNEVTKEVRD